MLNWPAITIGKKFGAVDRMRKQLRISQEQSDALQKLAAELNISGQRGAWFQPLILWLADTAIAAPEETAKLLDAAGWIASGGVWEENE